MPSPERSDGLVARTRRYRQANAICVGLFVCVAAWIATGRGLIPGGSWEPTGGIKGPTEHLTGAVCHFMWGNWARSLELHPAGPFMAGFIVATILFRTWQAIRPTPAIAARWGWDLGVSVAVFMISWVLPLLIWAPKRLVFLE